MMLVAAVLHECGAGADVTSAQHTCAALLVERAFDNVRAAYEPAVSREAGEVVEAVMDEMEICMERMPEGWIDAPARIVQRALDAAEERGANAVARGERA